MPLSVCSRTHQNSAPSEPPDPPPIWRSLRNVTASIRVIFIGSVFSTAARRDEATAQAETPIPHLRKSLRDSNPYRILCDIFIHFRMGGPAIVDVIEPLRILQIVWFSDAAIVVEQEMAN